MQVKRATKTAAKLRMGIIGPAGAGKTYTALRIATGLQAGRVVVIDTERGSASKYADQFDFDVIDDMADFSPQTFIAGIKAAEQSGAGVIIIDSLSHAWMGKDGALELVDKESARSKSSNSFAAWRTVTPLHNAMVDAILRSTCHVIVTMRSKTEWVLDQVERNGRTVSVPRKVGMAPVQRDGLEYEFDVAGDIDIDNTFVITKTRCSKLAGAVIRKPGEDLALTLREWLASTTAAPQPAEAAPIAPVTVPELPSPKNGIEMAHAVLAPLTHPPVTVDSVRRLVKAIGKADALPVIKTICEREIRTADDIPPSHLVQVCAALELLQAGPTQ